MCLGTSLNVFQVCSCCLGTILCLKIDNWKSTDLYRVLFLPPHTEVHKHIPTHLSDLFCHFLPFSSIGHRLKFAAALLYSGSKFWRPTALLPEFAWRGHCVPDYFGAQLWPRCFRCNSLPCYLRAEQQLFSSSDEQLLPLPQRLRHSVS